MDGRTSWLSRCLIALLSTLDKNERGADGFGCGSDVILVDEHTPKAQKIDLLKIQFKNQVELLRYITNHDWRIFAGFLTLQVLISYILSTNDIETVQRVGILVTDGAIAMIAINMLNLQRKRRIEALHTLQRVMLALSFFESGAYVRGIPIVPYEFTVQKAREYDPAHKVTYKTKGFRLWFHVYLLGIIIALMGVLVIAFGSECLLDI